MFKHFLAFLVFLLCISAAQITRADAEFILAKAEIPNARLVGNKRISYLFIKLYDLALYAPGGRWDEDKPFALSLTYLRSMSGKIIADQSIEEIRRQGFRDEVRLAVWHGQLRSIFPNVERGSVLTGARTRKGETVFYDRTREIGRIKDPLFSKYFFDIWLGQRSRDPQLYSQLTGLER